MAIRLRVATFNAHHCEGLDGRVDLERTAQVLREVDADVIALQELDRGMERSGRVDQPAALSHLSGLVISFHPTLERRGGMYGIALASRTPLDVRFEELPGLGDEEPRGMIEANAGGLVVIATHLSRSRPVRGLQLETVAARAAATAPRVVVLGDLNAPHAELGSLAGLALCSSTPTMPARRPRRQIDHVLAGPGVTLRSCRTIATDASDHRPLVADVEVV